MSDNDSSTNDCENASIEDIFMDKIISVLISLLDENKYLKIDKEKKDKQKKLIFYSKEIPTISLKDYLYRIKPFTDIEDNTLILSLIYIDKLCENESIILSENNIHRILFSSILIAIKFNEDLFFENTYYAKVAGVSTKELKKMEIEFLKLIKYELYVNRKIFEKYKKFLITLSDKSLNCLS